MESVRRNATLCNASIGPVSPRKHQERIRQAWVGEDGSEAMGLAQVCLSERETETNYEFSLNYNSDQ